MLNYWFSSNDTICADNYFFPVQVDGKCRSEKWELYLFGDMSIKVDRGIVGSVAQGVCLRLGSSPNLATYHTPSMCCACLLSVAWVMSIFLADPVSSGKYSGTSCRDVLHSHCDMKHHRCHCSCRDHVHCVGRLHCLCDSYVQLGCLRRLVV